MNNLSAMHEFCLDFYQKIFFEKSTSCFNLVDTHKFSYLCVCVLGVAPPERNATPYRRVQRRERESLQ